MRQEKYYVPNLEEFCIGFEFEFFDKDDKDWTKTKINTQSELCNWTGLDIEKRVGYISKENFLDLGFNSQIKDTIAFGKVSIFKWSSKSYLSSSWRELTITKVNNTRFLFEIEIAKNYSTEINKLEITLKNKTELNKFLNQLDII